PLEPGRNPKCSASAMEIGTSNMMRPMADGMMKEKNIPTTVKWENRFIQKENEKLLKITRDGFEKELQTYLHDCPELANKIGTEGYKPENLLRIVMEYNDCIESKK
ncbi:MAG: hypothetical protein MI922_30750, partial [Bacteroidales bacterium]|nr:hypothetical protein [Bacteroidales bacterium]